MGRRVCRCILGRGRGDRTARGLRTPPTESLTVLRQKQETYIFKYTITLRQIENILLAKDWYDRSCKSIKSGLPLASPGRSGLGTPGESPLLSHPVLGSPLVGHRDPQDSPACLGSRGKDCFRGLGSERGPARPYPWRAAVRLSEGGSGPSRAETRAGLRPRTASAPRPSPARASSRHPPPAPRPPFRIEGGRLQLSRSTGPGSWAAQKGLPPPRKPHPAGARTSGSLRTHARSVEGACGVTRPAARPVTPSRPLLKVGARGRLPCCPAPTPPLTFPPPPFTRRPAGPPTRPFPYQHPRPRQRRRRRTAPRRRHFVSEPVERLNRARSCFFGGSGGGGSRCGCAELAGDAGWPERWSGGGASAAGGVARR